jgi:hypothetical protein
VVRALGVAAGWCDEKTVSHNVAVRDGAGDQYDEVERASIMTRGEAKIEELVERSQGRIRADVVHVRIAAMGIDGSERTTRRAVADATAAYRAGRRRIYRPWITGPSMWLPERHCPPNRRSRCPLTGNARTNRRPFQILYGCRRLGGWASEAMAAASSGWLRDLGSRPDEPVPVPSRVQGLPVVVRRAGDHHVERPRLRDSAPTAYRSRRGTRSRSRRGSTSSSCGHR